MTSHSAKRLERACSRGPPIPRKLSARSSLGNRRLDQPKIRRSARIGAEEIDPSTGSRVCRTRGGLPSFWELAGPRLAQPTEAFGFIMSSGLPSSLESPNAGAGDQHDSTVEPPIPALNDMSTTMEEVHHHPQHPLGYSTGSSTAGLPPRAALHNSSTTDPLLSVETAHLPTTPLAAAAAAPSPPYRPHSSTPAGAGITATSPMMTDLLLALQSSQSEQDMREDIAAASGGSGTAMMTGNSGLRSTSNNLQAWMHPPPSREDSDGDDSEYLSPVEDMDEGSSEMQTVREKKKETTSKTNSGLRASLDAGMAAMGRWVRSKSSASATTPATPTRNQEGEESNSLLSSTRSMAQSVPRSSNFSNDVREEDEFTTLVRVGNNNNNTEEVDAQHQRQRSVSEPEMRDFIRYTSSSMLRQRRRNNNRMRGRANTGEETIRSSSISSSTQEDNKNNASSSGMSGGPLLSSSATAVLSNTSSAMMTSSPYASSQYHQQPVDLLSTASTMGTPRDDAGSSAIPLSTGRRPHPLVPTSSAAAATTTIASPRVMLMDHPPRPESPLVEEGQVSPEINDRERIARIRWIRINRRFQKVMAGVALLFSLLLFAILICWVVLTSTYVLSVQKPCDEPLKAYFWLVTLQLVLDVFRSDIMRFVFNWDARSNMRIPPRVILYNVAYLIYAVLVLRLGIRSVFAYDEYPTCRSTAPDLFRASVAFVTLSIAAWTTIICGYLLPFLVVAVMLTMNGYQPSDSTLHWNEEGGATQPVFPAAYSTSGAPPGCIDLLPVVTMQDLCTDPSFTKECCICMEEFNRLDTIVETKCRHIFHKNCCREWLRQSRTCPVCRADIPSTVEGSVNESGIEMSDSNLSNNTSTIPMGPSGRPVVGLLRVLRRATSNNNATTQEQRQRSTTRFSATSTTDDATAIASIDMEAGNAASTARY